MNILLVLLTSLFMQGNEYYANSEWQEAVAAYTQCLNDSVQSEGYLTDDSRSEVYYNLGNAYFKQGDLAQAILAYERCLRLQPGHKDAKFNLTFAQSRIIDNIEDNRQFFLASWAEAVRNRLTEKVWTVLSVILFVIMLACLLLFSLGSATWLRKTAFHTAWVSLLLVILTFANASSLRNRDQKRSEAIVTQGVLNAKSSPDESGTDLFTLHEGTKVEIKETIGNWCNVSVGNNEGWMLTEHLERI